MTTIDLGSVGTEYELSIPTDYFKTGTVVLGRSGFGKSMLLLLVSIQAWMEGFPIVLIDPDGRTARDSYLSCMEVCPQHKRDDLLYLRPGLDCAFHFDPFQSDYTGLMREQWLHRTIQENSRIIGRKQGIADFKQQARRERVLTDLQYFVSAIVKGRYMGFHRLLDALDIGSKPWIRWYTAIRPHLPQYVQNDFDRLQRLPPNARWNFTESAENIIRQGITPLISLMTQPGPTIDFQELLKAKKAIFIDLEETNVNAREEMEFIASIVLNQYMDAAYMTRIPSFLVLDEAGRLVASDLSELLARGRKRNVHVIVAAQTPGSFTTEYVDIADQVLSLAGNLICFNQSGGKDTRDLAHYFARRNWNFEKQYRPMDRPIDPKIIELEETSRSDGNTESDTFSDSWARTHSTDIALDFGVSEDEGESTKISKATGNGLNLTEDESETETNSSGHSFDEENNHRVNGGNAKTNGKRRGRGKTSTETDTTGNDFSTRRGQRQGIKQGTSNGTQNGGGRNRATGKTSSTTVSTKKTLAPQYREEWYATGLEDDLTTQTAKFEQALSRLGVAQALVTIGNGRTLPLAVHNVAPAKVSPKEIDEHLDRMMEIHDFLFIPGVQDEPPALPNQELESL